MSQEIESSLPPSEQAGGRFVKPTAQQWLVHVALFLITVVPTTIFGIVMAGPNLDPAPLPPPGFRSLSGSLFLLPWIYLTTVVRIVQYAFANPHFLAQ